MVTINKIINGMRIWLDTEMISNMQGLNKWIVGAGLAMYLDNATNIFNELKQNEMVKALQIIDEGDMIDLDKIYNYLIQEAKKCPATFKIPYVGAVTMHDTDIEKLYMIIKNNA